MSMDLVVQQCPVCDEFFSEYRRKDDFTTRCPACGTPVKILANSLSTAIVEQVPPSPIAAREIDERTFSDGSIPSSVALSPFAQKAVRQYCALWFAVTCLFVAVSFFFAGRLFWQHPILTGLAVLTLVGVWIWSIAKRWPRRRRPVSPSAIMGACTATVALSVLIGFAFPKSLVHVDNATDRELHVYYDDSLWLKCPAGSQQQASLWPGRYLLTIIDPGTGKEVDRRVAIIRQDPSDFVYNLLGAQGYIRGRVDFMKWPLGAGDNSKRPEKVWDAWLEPNVDHLFEEPPAQIKIRDSALAYESRSYFKRLNK